MPEKDIQLENTPPSIPEAGEDCALNLPPELSLDETTQYLDRLAEDTWRRSQALLAKLGIIEADIK
jgi:hypothetical protein